MFQIDRGMCGVRLPHHRIRFQVSNLNLKRGPVVLHVLLEKYPEVARGGHYKVVLDMSLDLQVLALRHCQYR